MEKIWDALTWTWGAVAYPPLVAHLGQGETDNRHGRKLAGFHVEEQVLSGQPDPLAHSGARIWSWPVGQLF